MNDFKDSIHKAFAWLKPGGTGVFVVLANEGDQIHIMKNFWNIFHPNRPLLNPSADDVEFLLSELGQDAYRKRTSLVIKAKTQKQVIRLISFILEINPKKLDGQVRNILDLIRKSPNGEYEINTIHEVIFFRKRVGI